MEVHNPGLRSTIISAATPFLKILSKIEVPVRRRVDADDAESMRRRGHPGSIMLTWKRLTATNAVIPGEWKHAAMYVGGGKVVEALGSGVVERGLVEFATEKDHVVMLEPTFCDRVTMAIAAKFFVSLVGLPYDYKIEHANDRTKNKAFYCSEGIWWSYDQPFFARGDRSPFTPRVTLGMPTVTPQDFANAKGLWKEIASWGHR